MRRKWVYYPIAHQVRNRRNEKKAGQDEPIILDGISNSVFDFGPFSVKLVLRTSYSNLSDNVSPQPLDYSLNHLFNRHFSITCMRVCNIRLLISYLSTLIPIWFHPYVKLNFQYSRRPQQCILKKTNKPVKLKNSFSFITKPDMYFLSGCDKRKTKTRK